MVAICRVRRCLAYFEIVAYDPLVLVLEARFMTEIAFLVVLALSAPKMNLCSPFAVPCLLEI